MKTPNTVVLISGYARAGKDTFADGMLSESPDFGIWKRSFASTLKDAANSYLDDCGLYDEENGASFNDEEFKIKHRDILVTLGRFARFIDKDVFASKLMKCFASVVDGIRPNPFHIIVPDWRYINELRVAKEWAETNGWRVITVRIDRAGLHPANEEEAMSLAEIRRESPCDYEYIFAEGQTEAIKDAGRKLAAQLGL